MRTAICGNKPVATRCTPEKQVKLVKFEAFMMNTEIKEALIITRVNFKLNITRVN